MSSAAMNCVNYPPMRVSPKEKTLAMFDDFDHHPSTDPVEGSWVSDCMSEMQYSSSNEDSRTGCYQRHQEASTTTTPPMTPKDNAITVRGLVWRSHNPYQRASLKPAQDILGRLIVPEPHHTHHHHQHQQQHHEQHHEQPHHTHNAMHHEARQDAYMAPPALHGCCGATPAAACGLPLTIPVVMCCYFKQRGTCKMGAGCWHGHVGLESTPCHYGARCKAGHAHLATAARGQPVVSPTTVDPTAVCRLCHASSLLLQVIPVYTGDHMERATRAMCPTCKGAFLL